MAAKKKCWDYTPDLGLRICDWVAQGRSLTKVGNMSSMPSRRTIRKWEEEHPEFAKRLEKANEDGADTIADKIREYTEAVAKGTMDPQAGRVAIDALKWTASKLKPRKYAERVDTTVTVNHSYVDDLAQLERAVDRVPTNGQAGPLIDVTPDEQLP